MPAPWSARREGAPLAGAAGGIHALTAAVWELDVASGELSWSAGMYRLAGTIPGAVTPSLSWWISLLAPADQARVKAGLLVARESGHGSSERFTMVGLDGVERIVHGWVEVESDADGRAARLFGSVVDVSDLRGGARDELTGLATRDGALAWLDRLLTPAPTTRVGVLLVGLDRFSVLTSARGRGHGDDVLIAVAGRLRSLVPDGCALARLDGDTFAVAVQGADATVSAMTSLAQRLVAAARRPHAVGERAEPVTVTASVGWAVADGDDPVAQLESEELLRRAALALTRAKRDGRDRAVAYAPAMAEAAATRVRSEAVLRSALDDGRLQVLYQPVIDLTTGAICGVEALGRIVDTELGPLSPAVFVDVSEETGLVTRLDEWVLGRASALAGRWRPPPHPRAAERAPTVAVNMSSRTLARADLAALVRASLRLSGSAPGRLLVEITEHSLLDQGDLARATLSGLQDLGVGVGIDDFGTGWSALSYLSALDLAFMKIDRCFVSRLGVDTSADAIVQAVVDLAHAHSLAVIAEGVETEDQARRLAEMGCDHGQGYWFGRPMREDDLDEAVRSWYERAEGAGFGTWGRDDHGEDPGDPRDQRDQRDDGQRDPRDQQGRRAHQDVPRRLALLA